MPNIKTGWTVPDLVQKTERVGEKEQESTNKGRLNRNLIYIKYLSFSSKYIPDCKCGQFNKLNENLI